MDPVNKEPAITIGLPVFNDCKFISTTLESLLAQSFRNFRLLVSDNASSDGTSEICQKFARRDSRICYIRHKENIGSHENFRGVLAGCKTDFFMWMGSHDLISTNYIESCLETLLTNKRIVLCYGNIKFIGREGQCVGVDSVVIDTRSIPFWVGYIRFLWEEEACFKMHGVARTWAAKAALSSQNFFGVDHHYLTSLCLVGHVSFDQRANFEARVVRSETYTEKVDRVLSDPHMQNPEIKSKMLWKECERQHIRSILRLRKLSVWTPILIAATKHAFRNRFQKFTRDALEGAKK